MTSIIKYVTAITIAASMVVGCTAEADDAPAGSTWTLTDGGWWATVTELPPTPVPGGGAQGPRVVTVGSDLLFEFGSSRLMTNGKDIIADITAELLATGASVRVCGHADVIGSEEVNVPLSRERAEEVAKAMVAAGFPKNRILAVEGYGSARPRALPADTPSNRALNRRVDIERLP